MITTIANSPSRLSSSMSASALALGSPTVSSSCLTCLVSIALSASGASSFASPSDFSAYDMGLILIFGQAGRYSAYPGHWCKIWL